jgi:hypothetical protein
MNVKIKKQTKADYKNVPKKYVLGRPLLTFEKLRKVPPGIKRLHDLYMQASWHRHHQCIYIRKCFQWFKR